jgi:hypothetical protein
MSFLLEINYKFCIIEYIKWTTGWLVGNGRSASRLTPRIAYQSSIRYLLKRLLTNRLNDKESSLALTPGRRPLGICRLRSLNEQHFDDLLKCWIFESRGRSRFGALRFQKWRDRSFEMTSRPSLFCDSPSRVSNFACVRSTDCVLICNFWFNDDQDTNFGLLMDCWDKIC